MPQGWAYDYTGCCGNKDCAPVVKPKKVLEKRYGYVVPSGEVLSFTDTKLRISKDGDFHWCKDAMGETICLYVPPKGF